MIKAGRYELDEESMGRIYQHVVSNPKTKSWAVITASRGENTPAENARKNKDLENDLRKMGLGFVHADGMWRECKNRNIEYKDCPEELRVPSPEKVLFIPNIPKDKAVALGKKYEQDSVLFADEETKAKGEATFIDSKSGEAFNIGKFTPGKIAQGYTKMKGDKVFTFLQPGEKGITPKEKPNKDDMKLKSLVPKGILDKMVKNPETGNMIKLKSALKKDKTSPIYKTAVGMVKQSKK
jgi:hypothetical protein